MYMCVRECVLAQESIWPARARVAGPACLCMCVCVGGESELWLCVCESAHARARVKFFILFFGLREQEL